MRLAGENLDARIGRLARLGRQRDFSLPRFRKSLAEIVHNGERGDILRQLLTDWTGIPFEAEEASQRWEEIERLIPPLREKLGSLAALTSATIFEPRPEIRTATLLRGIAQPKSR